MKWMAFPGWSAQRPLKRWCGVEVETISHLQQWKIMKGECAWDLPTEPWGMITWSMGSWMGLWASQRWAGNPPRIWIALSPFVRLVGDDCKIKADALNVLLRSFRAKPLETLQFFCRQQGGHEAWCSTADLQGHEQILGDSLEALLGDPPVLPSTVNDIHLKVLIGDRDRLVSVAMAEKFSRLFDGAGCVVETEILENVGHGIFYEGQPEAWARSKELTSLY
jgi:pimeloyl-ACP methyl ester carboxylesterase